MARARNIKPGFFKNELLVEQTAFVRLLFVGLWTLADREGRIEDRAKKIKLELFPYDDDDIEEALSRLSSLGFLSRYVADGKSVIQICKFLKHQSPHGTEKDSELPDETGEYLAHERDKRGYVSGVKRSNNVKTDGFNVKLDGNNVHLPEVNVHPVCNNALNPDSLNPDSLNLNLLSGSPDATPEIQHPDNPVLKNPKSANLEPRAVLAHLNKKTGRSYRDVPANLDMIAARLKSGVTLEQCLAVIDVKHREWGADSKMAEFLRPATLFNRTNFEQYLGLLTASPPQPVSAYREYRPS